MSPRLTKKERARERLIFALDLPTMREAGDYVRNLEGVVGMFKVGKQLFMKTGPRIIKYIHERGGEVFLDLKFHDIPQTVARASMEATRHGVAMFNLHASGSFEMMSQAVASVNRVCRTEKLRRPVVLAVTVLTSLSATDLRTIGVKGPVKNQVVRLAELAERAGMDGVVASPMEIDAIRGACSRRFVIVTPGIRREESGPDDQQRVLGAAEAIAKGADLIVVGRPIRDASDPRVAAESMVDEIALAMKAPGRSN